MRGLGRPIAVTIVAAASLVLASSAQAAPTVAAHWAMDETTGTTAVDSANGFNGTLTNVTLGLPGASGEDGDTAFGFNGQTSKMIVPKVRARPSLRGSGAAASPCTSRPR